jgi:shikimate kinase
VEQQPIVLVGMMGVGKSAVGRVLARRLARPFVDADVAIAERAGRPVGDIFAADGEAGFRDLEADVLDELLDRRPPVVLAAGGGVVVRPGNRRALRDRATVVWLQAPIDDLVRRVGSGRGRPLLRHDPAATLARLLHERGPWYAEVAGLAVDTAGRRPDDVADELARALAPAGSATGDRS